MTITIYFRSGHFTTFYDVTEVREVHSATTYYNYHIVLYREDTAVATFYMANIAGYSKQEKETEMP